MKSCEKCIHIEVCAYCSHGLPRCDLYKEDKRGRWVRHFRKCEDDDGFRHHMCSYCKTEAPFHYIYADDYDEGMDGEWYLLGQREDGIEEVLSDFCPRCGATMCLKGESNAAD